ncbi:Mesaconyl-C(4)-CoA hydratase [Lachnellula suecica]|uniref:Mesaconyl-C(4)-CoA hydratase n=1 Tax=Lachnellula suecica TaxID=602035 RepID=A0A8T9CQY9_9HELO|nr:Mesaconyl-C(4)-CoA hydratase [Lachnellula suecica]
MGRAADDVTPVSQCESPSPIRVLQAAMAQSFRRLYSSVSSSSATSVASQFLAKSQSLPPSTQSQLLDANQLQRFSATLSRPELSRTWPENGTPLPPCYHLAYFTPAQIEEELGRDGTDTTFNPPRPFTRRMWAGGELEWVAGPSGLLKIGQQVTETTKLISSVGKKTRAGEEMVVVGVEKEYNNGQGVALIDRRNWIFRPEITIPQAPASRPAEVPLPEGSHIRDFTQTPVTLFRFSALTFNAHKIHYSKEWCREVEGHRDLVVHGPLNLINIINFWRDVNGGKAVPRKVTYRATSPLYVGEPYRIVLEEEKNKITEAKIVDSYGKVGMVGHIESY